MSTYPPANTQMELLHHEIAELRILQERHERWTHYTDDPKVRRAHMRIASELEEILIEMEINLMSALQMIAIEGERKP